MGIRKNGRARRRHASRAPVLSFARYFQAPATQASLIEGVRFIEVFNIAQCLLTINFQRLLCTVIKFLVVKEAVLYFLQDADDSHTAEYRSNLHFLTAKYVISDE